MSGILIKNGLVVTVDSQDKILAGDLWVDEGRIRQIGKIPEDF